MNGLPENLGLIACDAPGYYVVLAKDSDWYGWVMREHPDGGLYSIRKATHDEIVAATWRRLGEQLPDVSLGKQRTPGRFA